MILAMVFIFVVVQAVLAVLFIRALWHFADHTVTDASVGEAAPAPQLAPATPSSPPVPPRRGRRATRPVGVRSRWA